MFLGYDINEKLLKLATIAEEELKDVFKGFEETALVNSAKVLKAFQDNRVSITDFNEVTGYGYYDGGRDKLEQIYSQVFGAEDSLVRVQIMSGTHALALTLFGLLKHGDVMISVSGEPYDSLRTIIGTEGDSRNSLIKHGIKYEQIELIKDDFDYTSIINRLKKSYVKLIEIQRSRGYSQRKSLTVAQIEKLTKEVKKVSPNTIVMVDNCYGDFVEKLEPTNVGVDISVGSLMKNLGGGIAKTGGYILGKKEYVLDVAERYSAPCIGKDLGANLNQNLSLYRGLYLAPSVVCNSLKTMAFASFILQELGYSVSPKYNEYRTDIIQTIDLNDPQKLVDFCKGIQFGSPIDSFVTPEPAPMPGYPNDEVMAGGSFISGSTIELSCDGPMVAPYTAYMQGGLTYEYGKLGILYALNNVLKNK
ncbi:MAG: methionine gamma-lyase family protein [Clostridia bacterium]|nr:methionine gamma-lyase family protein [Clostridia bacterium]